VYYLRALGVIYLRAPLKPATPSRGLPQLFVAVVCAVATLVFGCYPQPLLNLTIKAAPVPTAVPVGYVTTK
jgi:NADH-quinone oxidoreductase subunit N